MDTDNGENERGGPRDKNAHTFVVHIVMINDWQHLLGDSRCLLWCSVVFVSQSPCSLSLSLLDSINESIWACNNELAPESVCGEVAVLFLFHGIVCEI